MTTQSAAATCQVRESGIESRFLPHRQRVIDEEAVRQEERLRIAQELHDTCLQGFLALLMHLRVAACDCSGNNALRSRLEGLVEMACDAVEEGRRSVETLRASQPLESLEAAIAKIPQGLGSTTVVPLKVSVRGDARELSAVVWHEVYRIGREAIVNAYRHSGAGEIQATIEYEPDGLLLCVRDNGCGIGSSELVSGRPGHWGLQGMRERARRIGARLQFRTVSGSGTALELYVDYTQHADPSAK